MFRIHHGHPVCLTRLCEKGPGLCAMKLIHSNCYVGFSLVAQIWGGVISSWPVCHGAGLKSVPGNWLGSAVEEVRQATTRFHGIKLTPGSSPVKIWKVRTTSLEIMCSQGLEGKISSKTGEIGPTLFASDPVQPAPLNAEEVQEKMHESSRLFSSPPDFFFLLL